MSTNFIKNESNESILYTVENAGKLLSLAGHKEILEDIKKGIAFSDTRFEILYEELINNFVEYVQILNDVGKLSDEQLMNIGLERAYTITKNYIKEHGEDSPFDVVYTLFSAALLLDVGKVEFGRKIMVCNKRGIFLKEWQPIVGESIIDVADYYKVRESVNFSNKMCNLMTPLLAQKIVPEIGMICIRENPSLLVAWLSILSHDENADDDLSSNFKIYNRNFHEKRKRRLGKVMVDFDLIEGLIAGEAFWKWLKESLKDKKIEINKEGGFVHKVDSGLFIDYQELAKKFCSIYSDKFPSWTVVVRQFNSLGIAKLSGGDYKYEQFFGNRGKYGLTGMFGGQKTGASSLPNGIIIEDSRGLVDTKNHGVSKHLKALGAPNVDKNLQERSSSVYGIKSQNGPNYEPPK